MSQAEPIIIVNGSQLTIAQSTALRISINYFLCEMNEAQNQQPFGGVGPTDRARLREVMAIITEQPFSIGYCCRHQHSRHLRAADVQHSAVVERVMKGPVPDEAKDLNGTRGQVESVTHQQAPLFERRLFASRRQPIEPQPSRKQLVAR